MSIKVGYLGKHGTYSEIAAMQAFPRDAETVSGKDFPGILQDVERGALDYAVIPVENTTTGIIARSYDLFIQYDIHAVGETIVPVREDLIALPGTKIEEIREVVSHPEALSQCAGFFASHPGIRQVPFQDTASAVAYVKEKNDRTVAALGSWRAREYYGLEALMTDVQDSKSNMTRFLVIAKDAVVTKEADKISIMLVLRHVPGALYNMLGDLARNGVNILRLESRPIADRPFEYRFYIDFEGNSETRQMKEILGSIFLHSREHRLIGCYKAYTL
ncbi:MAG: prephenate dehydratase [Solobacterium sp.]|nr:prephenate dehydratase [Solobacterium sp.]